MKKICYVVTVPSTIRAFFVPQLQYLADNGFEVHVICSEDGGLQQLLGEKIKYIPLNMPRGISIGGTIKAIKELTRIFKKEKYDLVQYSTPNAAFNASIASKVAKIGIRNYHLMGLRYEGDHGLKRRILKMMEKISCRLSTHIRVSNSNMEIALKDKIFSREKATVVWNGSTGGIDLERFDISKKEQWRKEIRGKYKIAEETIVFGFVGRITRDKGINELFGAFQNLLSKTPNSTLLLVGDFEGVEDLEQDKLHWAEESKSVIFVSSVQDVEKYYAALDVLVLPSYREGFGNVIIESEAMGIPVIASNIPGPIDAMCNEVTGLQIRLKDQNDLYRKMERLLNDNIRRTYGVAARKFVEESFDSKILCGKIYQRKRELLSE